MDIDLRAGQCVRPDCHQSKWGSRTWHRLHQRCAKYNPKTESVDALCAELMLEGERVPCKECAEHWKEMWQRMGLDLKAMCTSRDSAFQVMYDIHNVWNLCLQKPFMRWSDALALYGLDPTTPYDPTPLMAVIQGREHLHGWLPEMSK